MQGPRLSAAGHLEHSFGNIMENFGFLLHLFI